MTSKQELLRKRVVHFYLKYKEGGKKFTFDHFYKEGVSKSTIYNILRTCEIKRKIGSGRKATIMTVKNFKKLKRHFNNKDCVSQNEAARMFGCSQQYISKCLKKCNIKARKKQKSPAYTEEQIKVLKSNCRWMLRHFAKKNFVLDDESYFSLSKSQMPGNNIYYSEDISTVNPEVKFKFKRKFEPKVMLYIAVSCEGVSEPFFKEGRLAINQDSYKNECLRKILIPFIKKYHNNNNYVFWPDKASSHYAKSVTEYLTNENIAFIPKRYNPTNLPQCRPIEDFFGELSYLVYKKGWKAKNIKQLKTRIRKCLKNMDTSGVQEACRRISSKLRKVTDYGPFICNH